MTSTVFLIVASVATAIFLFQFILSVFFGDLDADAHLETDLGSVISFKGLTHFCMGMGWYIYLSHQSDIATYLTGILIGIVFVFALWYLYKKAWQLQKENKPEQPEALMDRECTIYSHSDGRYVVQMAVNGALREVDVRSLSNKQYKTGDKATICKIASGVLYIQ